jgi:hypothetical protein
VIISMPQYGAVVLVASSEIDVGARSLYITLTLTGDTVYLWWAVG